jgi:hypothetical protein
VGCGVPSTIAPRDRNGPRTRIIGRRLNDSSPCKILLKFCAASRPARSRMVVPELPQSSDVPGTPKPNRPTPLTIAHEPSIVIATPIARSALAVDKLSPPGTNPSTCVTPSAMAPKRSARCPTLLSEGTGTLPTRGPLAGETTRIDMEPLLC